MSRVDVKGGPVDPLSKFEAVVRTIFSENEETKGNVQNYYRADPLTKNDQFIKLIKVKWQ